MKKTSQTNETKTGITNLGSSCFRPGFSLPGFSLIEVLVSLMILSVGLLAVAQMQVAAIRGIAFSRHMTSATYLARQQLEYLRSLPYDDNNPSNPPLGASGSPITSDGGTTVFYDPNPTTVTDAKTGLTVHCGDAIWGSTLRHENNPLDEQGNAASGDGGQYYVVWRVMRGLTQVCTGVTALGPGQMFIEVQVIWWERLDNMPSPLNFGVSWDSLQATGAHRVVISTLRQQNL